MPAPEVINVISNQKIKIGLVAGEVSGDILGAGLIKAIKKQYPQAEFFGIGGPEMIAQGCTSWFNMEELSIMGLVEVIKHLPRLLHIKTQLVTKMKQVQPDVFIGIDAPDFNLRLERNLKDSGIKTVHYVSPSVWAWRQKRIFSIAKATHLVLAFLPFEKAFYDKFQVPCRFIGHTMADAIPVKTDKVQAKLVLQLDLKTTYVAVLPGSRRSEIALLAEPFIQSCLLVQQQCPHIKFIVPMVNDQRQAQFQTIYQQIAPQLDFHFVTDARTAMIASDVVLLASGTAALEAMLVGRPMVVGYKVKPLTYWIAKKFIKTDYVALPNILAGKNLVPELLQQDCTAEALSQALLNFLRSDNQELLDTFSDLHHLIRKNADMQAAEAVLDLIQN